MKWDSFDVPIDKTAAIVASGSNLDESVEMNRDQLVAFKDSLIDEMNVIKENIGIRNKKHWRSLRYKVNKKLNGKISLLPNESLVREAILIGNRIQILEKHIGQYDSQIKTPPIKEA